MSLVFPRGGRHYVRVLDEVDLDLLDGQLVAVLAPPAQGKTTLLRVAAGVQSPDCGVVAFDGVELRTLSDRARSSLLASDLALMEHRRPELDLRVLELVALPMLRRMGRRGAYVRAAETLARVGLAECAEQRWESLADSERALLTLARGVVRRPRLLLLDDLMASLGIGAAEQIGRLLVELSRERGFAVMMSVSDAGATGWCDRVATLAGGELLLAAGEQQRDNVVQLELSRRASR
ncbi:MAG: ATP-binding cassette domain-containing protein [Solirubrobacteraceae bacterium]